MCSFHRDGEKSGNTRQEDINGHLWLRFSGYFVSQWSESFEVSKVSFWVPPEVYRTCTISCPVLYPFLCLMMAASGVG